MTSKQILFNCDAEMIALDMEIRRDRRLAKEVSPFDITFQRVQDSGMWPGCQMEAASAMMDMQELYGNQ